MASVLLASPPSLPASPIAHVPDWVIAQLRAQNGDCYRQKGGYVAKNSENQQSYQLSEGVIRLNGEVYLVGDFLGGGSFGKVYGATNIRFPGKKLAVKVGNTFGAINQQEQERLAHRGYGNEYGIVDNKQLSIMNYKGKTLNNYLNDPNNPIVLKEKFNLAIQLFTQLDYLHTGALSIDGKGIAHHDIKPENVTVNDKKELSFIDFGLSAENPKKIVTNPIGTPLYLPQDKKTAVYSREQIDLIASFRTCFDYGEGTCSGGKFYLNDPIYSGSVTPIFTEDDCMQHLRPIGSFINAHKVDISSAPQYSPINYAALLVCQLYGIDTRFHQRVLENDTLAKAIVAKYYEINCLTNKELQAYPGVVSLRRSDIEKTSPYHHRQIKNLININKSGNLTNWIRGRKAGYDKKCKTLFDYTVTKELGEALKNDKLLQLLQSETLSKEVKRGIAFAYRAGVTDGDNLQYLAEQQPLAKLMTKLFINDDKELIKSIFKINDRRDKTKELLSKHSAPDFNYDSLTKLLTSSRLFELAQDEDLNLDLRTSTSCLYYLDTVLPPAFVMKELKNRPKLAEALEELYKSRLAHDAKAEMAQLLMSKEHSDPFLNRVPLLVFFREHLSSLTSAKIGDIVTDLDEGKVRSLLALITNDTLLATEKKAIAVAFHAGVTDERRLRGLAHSQRLTDLVVELYKRNEVDLIKSTFTDANKVANLEVILFATGTLKPFDDNCIIEIIKSERLFDLAKDRTSNRRLRDSSCVLYYLDTVLPKEITASNLSRDSKLVTALSDLYRLNIAKNEKDAVAIYMAKNSKGIELFNKIKGEQSWQKHFLPLAQRASIPSCIFENWDQFESLVSQKGDKVYSWSNQQFKNNFKQKEESRQCGLGSSQNAGSNFFGGDLAGSNHPSPQDLLEPSSEGSFNYVGFVANLITCDKDKKLKSKTFPLNDNFPKDDYGMSLLLSLEYCKTENGINFDKSIALFRLHKYLKKFAGYASARNKEDSKSGKIKLVVEAIDKLLQSSCEDYDTLKENIADLNKVLSQNKDELTKPVNLPGITFFRFTEGKTQADRLERAITMFDELEKISDNTNKV